MAGVSRTLAGPVFGSVLLLIASPFVLDTENFDFVILRPRELNVARFSALFLAFGVLMVWMRAMLDRWLPQAAMEGPVTFGRLVWLFSGLSPLMWFVPRALATRLPRIGAGELALGVYVGLVAFGALLTAFFLGIFFEDSEGTGRAPVIGAFLVATAVATLAIWALQLMDRLDVRGLPLLRLAGYAMLVGTAISGAFRLVSDVREIL